MPTTPTSLALTTIADGSPVVAVDHRNNYAAVQTAVNALIADLAAGVTGQFLAGNGTTLSWLQPPGTELAYAEFTANLTVTGTEAAPQDLVSAGVVTFDGATAVIVEVFAEALVTGAVAAAITAVSLWDTTDLGRLGQVNTPAAAAAAAPLYARRKVTPSAGSHTFKARAWQSGANGTVLGGAGGVGVSLPGYIRITKA